MDSPPLFFFPSHGTLLRDEHIFFCQLSQCMSSDLHRRASAHDFQQLIATVSPFFSQTLTFWVSFQEKVGSICQARRKLQALIRKSCRFQSNIEIFIPKTFCFVFILCFFFFFLLHLEYFYIFFLILRHRWSSLVYITIQKHKNKWGCSQSWAMPFVISQKIYFQNFLYWYTPEVAQSKKAQLL